jgi:hypothetical protein
MWKVMNCCVIMHNLIIKSDWEEPMVDDHPFYHEGTVAQLDQVSSEMLLSSTCIKKSKMHQLQNDLVDHLW